MSQEARTVIDESKGLREIALMEDDPVQVLHAVDAVSRSVDPAVKIFYSD